MQCQWQPLVDACGCLAAQAAVYGVPETNIRGIPFGFKGFESRQYQKCMQLTPRNIDAIHMEGGSFLGTSSADADVATIVKW